MNKLDLGALEALLKAASPAAAWKVDIGVYEDFDGDEDLSFARGPMIVRKKGESYKDLTDRARKDAELLAALRTAAPKLIKQLRALEADFAAECVRVDRIEKERDENWRSAENERAWKTNVSMERDREKVARVKAERCRTVALARLCNIRDEERMDSPGDSTVADRIQGVIDGLKGS